MIVIGKVKLYTIEEVRRKFDVTDATIRKYVRDQRLAGQKMGRSWYISEEAIQDFFRGPYVKPAKPGEKKPKK